MLDAAEQDTIMRRIHGMAVNEALWALVVHDTNPHAPGRGVRGHTQAQHCFQDPTTFARRRAEGLCPKALRVPPSRR